MVNFRHRLFQIPRGEIGGGNNRDNATIAAPRGNNMPNFFTATSGGVSGIVGGNGFSAIANVLTIAGTVYTIASEIGSHVNGNGSFSDVEDPSLAAIAALREELKAEIDGLRDDITELEAALTDLIVSQFSGVQQQLLASAQSRAKSALDLLASYAIDQDVDRGEIISDASRALRDALSQAEQLLRPGQDLETIKVAIGAVAYTLYARMEVARELEGGEIASDKITRQIEDVMTFFDNVVTYVISRLSVEYGFEDLRQTEGSPDYDPALQALYEQYTADYPPSSSVFVVFLDDREFLPFYSAGFEEFEGRLASGYYGTPFAFSPDVVDNAAGDFEGPYLVAGTTNQYYIPSIDRIITLNSGEFYDDAGNPVASDHPEARSANEIWFAECSAWVLEQTLQWFGIDRVEFAELVANYLDLTDGEQFILPSIPGFDNAGTVVGTDGDDLIIGNDGDDLLQGGGDPDIIKGNEGNDTVEGGTGGDRLEGNEGNDILNGGEDNDALIGGPGDDTIDGGDGLDLAIYYGKRSEYVVTSYADAGIRYVQVEGPEGTDTLTNVERLVFDDRTVQIQSGGSPGLLGDILFSDGVRRIADDLMFLSGFGLVQADGGMGEDTISALATIDTIIDGGPGNDLLRGSWSSVLDNQSTALFSGLRGSYLIHPTEFGINPVIEVSGPDGMDILTSFTELEFSDMTVGIVRASFNFTTFEAEGIGDLNDDIVLGTPGAAYLEGGGRNDTILAGSGDDTIHGGSTAPGPDGSDLIEAGAGDDLVWGDAGNDTIRGQEGDDTLIGGMGMDILDGGGDSDTASYRDSSAGLIADLQFPAMNSGEAKGDSYIGIENLEGSAFSDSLRGDPNDNGLTGGIGDDTLIGRGGNDLLQGDLGGDRLIGGTGTDTASYLSSDAGIIADLAAPASNTGDARGDTYSSVENILGSTWGDALRGNHLGNLIQGLGGDDIIIGRQGADTLVGGEGFDNLRGDGGNDVLRGGDDEDLLIGGMGRDMLTGGADADCFAFASAAEMGANANRDQILDFEQGVDMISLAGVVPGVLEFRGTAAFDPSGNPELRLMEMPSGSTIIQVDVDGDGLVDGEIRVANVVGLTEDDFTL
ncbi:hypothetical protein CDZ97_19110 [Mameliella alba]|nr:hypothetical protein CDZ95_22735 [Mameliella alba]OWV59923.1 hypothetical protein CDZ97_19110 [Mameliella alba]